MNDTWQDTPNEWDEHPEQERKQWHPLDDFEMPEEEEE